VPGGKRDHDRYADDAGSAISRSSEDCGSEADGERRQTQGRAQDHAVTLPGAARRPAGHGSNWYSGGQ
jgi:hypothetical protein